MPENITIVWFRQDLRLADNPALMHAARQGKVLPVYILDDDTAGSWQMGAASRWWLHQSLAALDQSMEGKLQVFQGDPLNLLPQLAADSGASSILWNRCYEPWRLERDRNLKEQLSGTGITVESFNGSLLWEPWGVLKNDGTPYKVFTPYYTRGCRSRPAPRIPLGQPTMIEYAPCKQRATKIDHLGLMPAINWYESMAATWRPGEHGSSVVLNRFLDEGLQNYKAGRDFPALQAVSRLSPYLHFGEISPNQAWYQVEQAFQSQGLEVQGEHFQRELAWREFSHYLLFHFPHVTTKNLQSKFDAFPWHKDEVAFQRWCQGQTGYPIIDAGMRELWQTGYMHNRVRMIVASFLVKNLRIHWHRGARWFWDCLVDADLANNSASWQWVAGSGADAAPYFRIFNPVTQSLRFDKDARYIRKYVPEISGLPDKYIHDPSNAPAAILETAGVVLDKHYPRAIVDLKESRQRALDAFKSLQAR